MLRNQRTHNAEQPSPETRQATSRAAHGCRESLGGPAVQHGIEHGLEEILHREEAFVLGDGVDDREEQNRGAHKRGGEAHCPLATDGGYAIHETTEEDADDAGGVGVDVSCVGVRETDFSVGVLESQNSGKVKPCDCQ